MKWILKKFDALSVHELYTILRLRSEVFGVEQHCVYQDVDNKDQSCYHLMGLINDQLAAYTRIVPPGVSYAEASIGRVVTSALHRRTGLGRELMNESIRRLYELFGKAPVRIGAQLYLLEFYSSLGFIQTGDVYDEDGIAHIQMLLS
ncbi:MAG TPA: GNAT family N-acetyltransferase [Chitinophagaceae bacterium]|nr:GNAT family N-acetyltransferase [Chitinophagaceae bacterium]